MGYGLDGLRCAVVGLPTWILVNGIWAAVSGIADKAPEEYAISAYLILCLSTGNLCPLIMNTYVFRNITSRGLILAVIVLDIVGLCAGILMALLWEHTVLIGKTRSSLYLFIFFLLIGASTSAANVAKFMLVANLSATHTSHLSVGMALGSMIAGLVGIIRGFTDSDGFSVSIYLLLLCIAYVPSVAVMAIYYESTRRMQEEYTSIHSPLNEDVFGSASELLADDTPVHSDKMDSELIVGKNAERSYCCISSGDFQYFKRGSTTRGFLLAQGVMAGLGFGWVPAILSTVCSRFRFPYTFLFLATGLSSIMDPVGRYLTAVRSLKTNNEVHWVMGILSFIAVSFLVLSALPMNSIYRVSYGGVIPAVLYVCFLPLFGYLNTSIFLILKQEAGRDIQHGSAIHRATESNLARLSGIMTQGGAMLGSVISFVVIYMFLQ